ncbi:hypothetical protein BACCAP_01334 [Pseudoflavonifractor capillosus ATCC 29799]|uniref:Uncharacterized protein n=1 Tax=Pseudoflavonifractor capillosus ATCC 29799 TaxID=411467 RepID=A6NT05_9FIRM|nr:hypothetical protein BACCAP_01334 [Pseudoflavonifractor capillosus ATCC 29799]
MLKAPPAIKKAPLSPKRDKGANLCGTTLLAAGMLRPLKPADNGAARTGLVGSGPFSRRLRGDFRPSASPPFTKTAALWAGWAGLLFLFLAFAV